MTIDRLNSIDPLRDPMKPAAGGRAQAPGTGDSISISPGAAEKAELFNALEIAKAAPEVRADRVAELKARMADPTYLDDSVISMTADRILEQLIG